MRVHATEQQSQRQQITKTNRFINDHVMMTIVKLLLKLLFFDDFLVFEVINHFIKFRHNSRKT